MELKTKENIPTIFKGIAVKNLFHTVASRDKENPDYIKIKEISINDKEDYGDRKQAIRLMYLIPRVNRNKDVITSILSILQDPNIELKHKCDLISGYEQRNFVSEILFPCHVFYYNNFPIPLNFKIQSMQYILENRISKFTDVDLEILFSNKSNPLKILKPDEIFAKCEKELFNLSINDKESLNIRAQSADILIRCGSSNFKALGEVCIDNLSDFLKVDKKLTVMTAKTIYSNSMNVHDKSITISVYESLQCLISTVIPTYTFDDIYEKVLVLSKNKEKVMETLQSIKIDTSKFLGVSVEYILCIVYQKLSETIHSDEIFARLIQELEEFENGCSSRYVSTFVNCFSGFNIEGLSAPIKISFDQQLKSNIYARLEFFLKTLPEEQREDILEEMTSSRKQLLDEFLDTYSPYSELKVEFVPKYMALSKFNEIYEKSIKEYRGY